MIHRTPEPRLEPTHYEEESTEPEILDDYDLEMMEEQSLYKCGLTDEQLNEIYMRLGL